jgi:hypothetical protein
MAKKRKGSTRPAKRKSVKTQSGRKAGSERAAAAAENAVAAAKKAAAVAEKAAAVATKAAAAAEKAAANAEKAVAQAAVPKSLRATAATMAAAPSFRALCQSNDFEGPERATRPEARSDARGHQSTSGHVVDIIIISHSG